MNRKNSWRGVVLSLVALVFSASTICSQSILYETYTDRAKLAYEKGDFTTAATLFKSALSEAERLNEQELIATACVNLGKLHHSQGRLDEAEKLYLRGIKIFRSIEGEDGELSAFPLNNLGLLYTEQKKYDQAEEILRQTITIREKLLGKDDSDVGVTLLNLGKLYADQLKFTEADAVYVRSLQILIQHPEMKEEILICLHDLALTTKELRSYKRTEAAYKMSVAIIEKHFGKKSYRLAEPLKNYSSLLKLLKRTAESKTIDARIKLLETQE